MSTTAVPTEHPGTNPETPRNLRQRRQRPAPQLTAPPGPLGPQPGIPAGPGRVMVTCPAPAGHLYVIGAHGGAGESTIAAWTGGRATDHRWPVSATWSTHGQPAPNGQALDVVLVARTSAVGLTAARGVLTHWAAGRLPANRLAGLVFIPDAPGRLPKPLAELAHLIAGGAPRAWLLPWLDPLRLVPDPRDRDPALVLPRQVQKFTADLRALTAIHPTDAYRTDVGPSASVAPSPTAPVPAAASPVRTS